MKKCKVLSTKKIGEKQTFNISMKSNQHNYAVFGEDKKRFVISKNSTAYGYITYQTAYLKTYYPAEFMSALLTSAASQSDDKLELVKSRLKEEYKKMEIILPDINSSKKTYSPTEDSTNSKPKIRAPFMSMKGVGTKVSDAIVDAREEYGEFISIEHFLGALNSGVKSMVSNSLAELLILKGSFDSIGDKEKIMQDMVRYNSIRKRVMKGKKSYNDPLIEQEPVW